MKRSIAITGMAVFVIACCLIAPRFRHFSETARLTIALGEIWVLLTAAIYTFARNA